MGKLIFCHVLRRIFVTPLGFDGGRATSKKPKERDAMQCNRKVDHCCLSKTMNRGFGTHYINVINFCDLLLSNEKKQKKSEANQEGTKVFSPFRPH